MPLLNIVTTATLDESQAAGLQAEASRLVAEVTGKPETYMMITLSQAGMLMGGQPGPAAYLDLRAIGGLTPDVNRRLSEKLCRLLETSLGVPANRVYITFTDLPATHWGWDGGTFA